MAKIVSDPGLLPERTTPIPTAKPPVRSLPFKDLGDPEEVDTFLAWIRALRKRDCPTEETE